jgi:hypothetical protein
MRESLVFIFVFFAVTTAAWGEQAYSGTYAAEGQVGPVTVVLKQGALQGQIQGTMRSGGVALEIQGAAEPPGISGMVVGQGIRMNFVAHLQGEQLFFKLIELDEYGRPDYNATETLIFQRMGSTRGTAPTVPSDTPRTASGRNVVINGTRLSDEKVGLLEQRYHVKIQDGTYWYDKVCGAWGLEGGPTAGFILPNLAIGGPLKADASKGSTGVFVNGRELHIYDVLALQQLIGTVMPGRYWLDGQGNVGIEGGSWLFNLIRIAQAAHTRRGQGGTTYRSNITGIGGGSSGGTSYVMGKDWAVMVGP